MAERSIEETAAEVLRLDRAATPRPWRVGDSEDCPDGDADVVYGVGGSRGSDAYCGPFAREEDARLIATYRTAAPELAREVQRLQIRCRSLNELNAQASGLMTQAADLTRTLEAERDAAREALRDTRNDLVICKEVLAKTQHERDAARARVDELLREQERRYDCHAGPGTTEPACGACTTCLLRELDARGPAGG